MSRLIGVTLAALVAVATSAISRPASAQEVITTYYAPAISTPIVSEYPVTTACYAPAPVTTYYAPSPVTTYYAPTPVTSYYAPTTSYYAPTTSYYAPTTSYYAPTPVTSYYAATPYVAGYAPAPVYVRPRVYVPYQPVRNFFRAL
jgi:hypothetical protein